MKRFYCTVCKAVKRVRNLPATLDRNSASVNPSDRIGECDKHSAPHVSKLISFPASEVKWTPANTQQAEARFTRKKSKKAGR